MVFPEFLKKRRKIVILTLLLIITAVCPFVMSAYASTPLHDKPPGTVITFSGAQWIILSQEVNGETYVIHSSNIGARAFDPDNTNLFNPSDSDNVAYYLNNTYYNSLSQKDLIADHTWDRVSVNANGLDSTNMGSVTCKIGLLSYREYEAYSSYYNGNILPSSYSYSWWTRTPRTEYSNGVCYVCAFGNLSYNSANNTGYCVRPALYLKSGILVSDTNEVIGEGNVSPVAPIGLNAEATSSTSVNLTWQANTEENLAGYIIYRNDIEIKTVGLVTSYTDTVSPGTTYTYKIKAYDTENSVSGFSSAATVTTPIEAPTELNLTWDIDGTTVNISWTCSNADYYRVYIGEELKSEQTETIYSFTGERGKSYTVRVVAYNGCGETEATANISISEFAPPSGGKMAEDLLTYAGLALVPMGSLLALGLALKASPVIIGLLKMWFLK